MITQPIENLLILGEKISRGRAEPNRVIVASSGKAVSVKHAESAQYNTRWQVCFIRDDGWSLAATEEMRDVAFKQWSDEFAVVVERGGIPHPVLNGRCPENCGACCRYLVVEVEEIDAIREPRIIQAIQTADAKYKLPLLSDEGQEFVSEWPDQPCLTPRLVDGKAVLGCHFLNGKSRCDVYASRPGCCVALPVGGVQCRKARETMYADLASKSARKATEQ